MFAECYFPRLSKSKKTVLFRSSRPGPATSAGKEARAKGLPQPSNIQAYIFNLALMINGLKLFQQCSLACFLNMNAVFDTVFNICYYFMGNCKKPRSRVKAMAGQLTLNFGMRSWKAPGKPGALFQLYSFNLFYIQSIRMCRLIFVRRLLKSMVCILNLNPYISLGFML